MNGSALNSYPQWVESNGYRFKRQKYTNSCFAASLQILRANLSSQHVMSDDLEEYERQYMLQNYRIDIKRDSPTPAMVHRFFEHDDRLFGLLKGRLCGEINGDFEQVLPEKLLQGYNIGAVLIDNRHATVLFRRSYLWKSRYVYLDPALDYYASDMGKPYMEMSDMEFVRMQSTDIPFSPETSRLRQVADRRDGGVNYFDQQDEEENPYLDERNNSRLQEIARERDQVRYERYLANWSVRNVLANMDGKVLESVIFFQFD